jgi:hypothetical protein
MPTTPPDFAQNLQFLVKISGFSQNQSLVKTYITAYELM